MRISRRCVVAICKAIGEDPDDVSVRETSEWTFGSRTWLILTDGEADRAAYDEIAELLWAFSPAFLAAETGLDQNIFDAFAKSNLCEGANPAIRAIVDGTCGLEGFVRDAVTADGRGHFLAGYDGAEIEVGKVGPSGKWVYAYRIN